MESNPGGNEMIIKDICNVRTSNGTDIVLRKNHNEQFFYIACSSYVDVLGRYDNLNEALKWFVETVYRVENPE